MSSDRPIRVAILGARGIGRVHARIFDDLGAEVRALLGSTAETAAAAARDLSESFGIDAEPFHQLEDLGRDEIDAVSVCTPHPLHESLTLECLDRGWSVFCEKPLLWRTGITSEDLSASLAKLESHPARRLFVNTSNATFLDPLLSGNLPVDAFALRLRTRGSDRREAIAVDLLPHALSFLLRLYGERNIEALETEVGEHRWSCRLRFGGIPVELDLGENPEASKAMSFSLGERRFTRVQEGSAQSYRVFLQEEGVRERLEVPDPFRVYIERFLDYCRSGAPIGDDCFDEAAANARLMSRILLEGG